MINKIFYELKRFLLNLIPDKSLRKKLKSKLKKTLYKCEFVSINEFVEDISGNITKKHIEQYDMNTYVIKDAFISIFPQYSLVHKFLNNKMVYFYEAFNYECNEKMIAYYTPLNTKNAVYLDKCCDLYCFWADNYWHFTFEVLPKIILLETQGFDGSYIVPDVKFIDDFFEILKIHKNRIVKASAQTIYLAKELTLVEPLHGQIINNKSSLFLKSRQTILDNIENLEDSKYPDKIFVRRIGKRKIINEKEIIDFLTSENFKSIIPDELPLKEQIKYFYNAKICITPHGANSSNAFYMKENSTFIETFSHRYINPCVLNPVLMLKLNYHIIPETTNNIKIKKVSKDYFEKGADDDYRVDVNVLKSTLAYASKKREKDE